MTSLTVAEACYGWRCHNRRQVEQCQHRYVAGVQCRQYVWEDLKNGPLRRVMCSIRRLTLVLWASARMSQGLCFLTQSVQLTLSSVQLTLLECIMWSSKMQWRFLTEMISYLHNIPEKQRMEELSLSWNHGKMNRLALLNFKLFWGPQTPILRPWYERQTSGKLLNFQLYYWS